MCSGCFRNVEQRYQSVGHNRLFSDVDNRDHSDMADRVNADNDTLVDNYWQYSFVDNSDYGFTNNCNYTITDDRQQRNVDACNYRVVYKCDDWHNDAIHNSVRNNDDTWYD